MPRLRHAGNGGRENTQQARGQACEQPDGGWQVVQNTPGLPAQTYVLEPPGQPGRRGEHPSRRHCRAGPHPTSRHAAAIQLPVTVGGQPRQAFIEACPQPDGSWKIMQNTPGLPTQVYQVPPPASSSLPLRLLVPGRLRLSRILSLIGLAGTLVFWPRARSIVVVQRFHHFHYGFPRGFAHGFARGFGPSFGIARAGGGGGRRYAQRRGEIMSVQAIGQPVRREEDLRLLRGRGFGGEGRDGSDRAEDLLAEQAGVGGNVGQHGRARRSSRRRRPPCRRSARTRRAWSRRRRVRRPCRAGWRRSAGPTRGPCSVPRPTDSAAIFSVSLAVNSSATDSSTWKRFAATHDSPMLRILATIACSTARSMSASAKTRKGALPPSSIDSRSRRPDDCSISSRPTSVDPVNDSLRSRESSSSGFTTEPLRGRGEHVQHPVRQARIAQQLPERQASSAGSGSPA